MSWSKNRKGRVQQSCLLRSLMLQLAWFPDVVHPNFEDEFIAEINICPFYCTFSWTAQGTQTSLWEPPLDAGCPKANKIVCVFLDRSCSQNVWPHCSFVFFLFLFWVLPWLWLPSNNPSHLRPHPQQMAAQRHFQWKVIPGHGCFFEQRLTHGLWLFYPDVILVFFLNVGC